jgi:hypothetical protein
MPPTTLAGGVILFGTAIEETQDGSAIAAKRGTTECIKIIYISIEMRLDVFHRVWRNYLREVLLKRLEDRKILIHSKFILKR